MPRFSKPLYLLANPDVFDQVRNSRWDSGLEHWLAEGRDENRPLTPVKLAHQYAYVGIGQ